MKDRVKITKCANRRGEKKVNDKRKHNWNLEEVEKKKDNRTDARKSSPNIVQKIRKEGMAMPLLESRGVRI